MDLAGPSGHVNQCNMVNFASALLSNVVEEKPRKEIKRAAAAWCFLLLIGTDVASDFEKPAFKVSLLLLLPIFYETSSFFLSVVWVCVVALNFRTRTSFHAVVVVVALKKAGSSFNTTTTTAFFVISRQGRHETRFF